MEIVYKRLDEIKPYPNNPRKNQKAVKGVAESIKQFGFRVPIALDPKTDEIICGHTRYKAAKKLKMEVVPCIYLHGLSKSQIRAYRLADNKISEYSKWDEDLLLEELAELVPDFNMEDFGFKMPDDNDEGQSGTIEEENTEKNFSTGREQVVITPSSVLEPSKDYQKIYEYWKALGIIKSDGRADDLLGDGKKALAAAAGKGSLDGTSVFNPVLCQLMYEWFCPRGGIIFDPFAGGYTRGIVATKLGYEYIGIDLRQEQIDADVSKAEELELSPVYICDDSLNADAYVQDGQADMIMTCPPYYDLEVYSEDPNDLSNMSPEDFLETYKKILEIAYRKLKDNRFFVIVIGEVRDKKGNFREFVADTIKHLTSLGMNYWNEIILRNNPATNCITARRPFSVNRKVSSIHQNVLVFYKGNPQEMANNWGEEDF